VEEHPVSDEREGSASDEEATLSWEELKMGYGNTAVEEGHRAYVAM
jgi:hypothetical protein